LITKYGMLISHLIFSLYNCNDRCFEDSKKTLAELMSLFFSTLYSWTAAFLAPFVFSFHDYLVLYSSPS
jgi:hypothetical protein